MRFPEYRQTLSSYRKQPAAQIKKLRGDALFGMRQYGKAVKLYQEILDNPPEEAAEEQLTAQVWNNLGACYGCMFLFDKAAEAFENLQPGGSQDCLRSLYWIEKLDSRVTLGERFHHGNHAGGAGGLGRAAFSSPGEGRAV